MTGYFVLQSRNALEWIVACAPVATLENTCLAHYPEIRDLTTASIRAAREFVGITHIVLSARDAEAQVLKLARKRRTRAARQARAVTYARRRA